MHIIPVAILPQIPSYPTARVARHQLLLGILHIFWQASSCPQKKKGKKAYIRM